MSVFDRPTSKELLEAVIDFIDAEIKSDSYPANKKFKFQIVLNVLNIIKREVETGKEINEKFAELGSKLIGEAGFSIEKLSKKIRNKESDQNYWGWEFVKVLKVLEGRTIEWTPNTKRDDPDHKHFWDRFLLNAGSVWAPAIVLLF